MEDPVGLLVVNGFMNGGAWQFQGYDEERFAQISEWKTHWCTQSVVQRCRDCVQKDDKMRTWVMTVVT